MPWFLAKWVVIGVIIAGLAGTVVVQTSRLKASQAEVAVEKFNTKNALAVAAAEKMARLSAEMFQRQLEDQRRIAEAEIEKLREDSRNEIDQLRQAERDGKARDLSPAAREYFDRLRRKQSTEGDSAH